jgi:hypothetical protein
MLRREFETSSSIAAAHSDELPRAGFVNGGDDKAIGVPPRANQAPTELLLTRRTHQETPSTGGYMGSTFRPAWNITIINKHITPRPLIVEIHSRIGIRRINLAALVRDKGLVLQMDAQTRFS